MYATPEQVTSGLSRYLDTEILPHLAGAKRVLAGTYATLALANAPQTIAALRQNQAVKILGIFDDAGNLDADKLRAALTSQMPGGKLSLQLPVLGLVTFTGDDIDKLYTMIGG